MLTELVTKLSDEGNTCIFNSNPAGHYTVQSDGTAWVTGPDGVPKQVSSGEPTLTKSPTDNTANNDTKSPSSNKSSR